jgi:hypothetical protein
MSEDVGGSGFTGVLLGPIFVSTFDGFPLFFFFLRFPGRV